MRRRLHVGWLGGAVLVMALGARLAPAEDMAGLMPCDAAVYIGWSAWLTPDAPDIQVQQKLLQTALESTAQAGTATTPAWVKPLLEMLSSLQTGSVGVGLFDVTVAAEMPEIEAALLVGGADAPRLPEVVHKLFVQLAGAEHVGSHTVGDAQWECAHLEGVPLLPVWGRHKDYFVFAIGDAAASKVVECIEGRRPSLATVEEFAFNRNKVGAHADGRHFCLYVDVQRLVVRAREIAAQALGELPPMVDPLLDELGITAVRAKYLHVDQENGQPRMAGFAHLTGPPRGLLKLWDQQPLNDDDLKIIPKNAYWAEVANLDLVAVWQEVLRIVEVVAPEQVAMIEGAVAGTRGILGFSVTDELLPAFGDTWAIFDAPDHGGLLLSGTVLVAEVKDVAALGGMLTRLVELVTPLAKAGDITLRPLQTGHGPHAVHYVLLGGKPVPIAPAWGFVGDRWVFGLSPHTVAAAMRQVDPQTRGPSLLDHPEFQAARVRLPKDVQGIGYFDSRYFARMWYPLLRFLQTAGVSTLAAFGGELDLAFMPPLPDAIADVANYVGTSSTDADGILYLSVGTGAPLPAVAGTALATSILLPSLAQSREVAKRAVSAANLHSIGVACYAYAMDQDGEFPDNLDQLLHSGAIVQKMLRSPRDPSDDESAVSYVYLAGQSPEADPRNVLAYERPVDEEGTNVLFVDGHVEWLALEPFKAAVRETYRRLGRDEDLPPEFRE